MTAPHAPGLFDNRVVSNTILYAGVSELTLQPSARLAFLPGQYLELAQPDPVIWRPFSIASPPEQSTLVLLIRTGETAFSEFVRNLAAGDAVRCRGPQGRFTYRPSPRSVAFLASGTGLAPFHSVLTSKAFSEHHPKQVVLFQRAGRPSSLLYAKQLSAMADLDWRPTVLEAEPGWNGHVGPVRQQLAAWAPRWEAWDFYLCGKPAWVDELRRFLLTCGVPATQIFTER